MKVDQFQIKIFEEFIKAFSEQGPVALTEDELIKRVSADAARFYAWMRWLEYRKCIERGSEPFTWIVTRAGLELYEALQQQKAERKSRIIARILLVALGAAKIALQ